MSKLISIRNDLYETLKELKGEKEKPDDQVSFSDVIGRLLDTKFELEHLIETTVTQEGRFIGSKSLAGKTILYKPKGVKE